MLEIRCRRCDRLDISPVLLAEYGAEASVRDIIQVQIGACPKWGSKGWVQMTSALAWFIGTAPRPSFPAGHVGSRSRSANATASWPLAR